LETNYSGERNPFSKSEAPGVCTDRYIPELKAPVPHFQKLREYLSKSLTLAIQAVPSNIPAYIQGPK